jgi:heterodisulfide reductase subunit A
MEPKNVMIIGGGIAGMTAAQELAEAGLNVDLVEKSGFLGGHAIQYTCKATSECLQCGACSVEKMLKDVVENDKINVHLSTEIESIEKNTIKKNNGYSIKVKKSAAFIDAQKCTNCGICYDKLKENNVILQGYSKNNTPLYAINTSKIDENKIALKEVCPEGAISVSDKASSENLTADAVVVATGFTPFDPNRKSVYGYDKFPNVISGLDLERIKRQKGFLARPSDGAEVQKVAFIQCVGSRDENLGNLWCSQVCCPYALRTAECTPAMEEFDMVVLSIGIMPNSENEKLSAQLNIALDSDGFFANSDVLDQTSTSNDGMFIAGTAQGPKSIAASMAQAGQAASGVLKYVGVTK